MIRIFKIKPGLAIVITGSLIILCAVVLIFLRVFHVMDAPELISILLGLGGAVFFLGIGYVIFK